MFRTPPGSTRTASFLPYTTRFRADAVVQQKPDDPKVGDLDGLGRSHDPAPFVAIGSDGPPRRLGSCLRFGPLIDRPDELAWLFEGRRSEEHTSELQSLMRISYAVFCSTKTTIPHPQSSTYTH